VDKQLGQTYGPLLGIIGLLLWAYLTSIAIYLGLAFAAQLESLGTLPPAPSTPSEPDVTVTLPEAEPVPAAAPVLAPPPEDGRGAPRFFRRSARPSEGSHVAWPALVVAAAARIPAGTPIEPWRSYFPPRCGRRRWADS
jgi:hypothetical protein